MSSNIWPRTVPKRQRIMIITADENIIDQIEKSNNVSLLKQIVLPSEDDNSERSDKQKTAAWRITFTVKEIEQQQALALGRSMTKRATISPKETEKVRVLARTRSTEIRAAYAPKQSRATASSGS
ncbi:unnamed protein product [Rotaria sordida]|uniref:Uncharacterized protein n=2 Tax=Rotaria sordida TaxID=392033 RepID=A0A814SZB5_9BILA|nr:unnamed protein product [Rotaria sordida]